MKLFMFQSLPARMKSVLTWGPAAGRPGWKASSHAVLQQECQAALVSLLVGFAFVSSSSPVPPTLTAVQPGGRASFLGLSSGFSCLKATPSPSIVLLHPPGPTSFLSQSPSAITSSDQASIPAFLSPADTYPLPVACRAPVCSSFLPAPGNVSLSSSLCPAHTRADLPPVPSWAQSSHRSTNKPTTASLHSIFSGLRDLLQIAVTLDLQVYLPSLLSSHAILAQNTFLPHVHLSASFSLTGSPRGIASFPERALPLVVFVQLLSHVPLFATPWTAACQVPLSFKLSAGVCSHSCPLSQSCPLSRWCHPTVSSSVTPFASFTQSSPASGSFPHLTSSNTYCLHLSFDIYA